MAQYDNEKLRRLEKDIIARRLAGLPNNVTTWKYKEPVNDVLNIDGQYFKMNNVRPAWPYTTDDTDDTDWEYKNALMYRLFGDDAPMQQYLNQKQAERQSRDTAIYNQYIAMQNKEEQAAEKEKEKALLAEKEKEAKRSEEKEKEKAKQIAKSNFRKSVSDISTPYAAIMTNLDELYSNGYLDKDEYEQQKIAIEKEKPRRQAHHKYSQYKSFATDSEKRKILTDIENDPYLSEDDKIELKNVVTPLVSLIAQSEANARAGKAAQKAGETYDKKSLNQLVEEAIKTGNMPSDDTHEKDIMRELRNRGYTVKGTKVVKR